MTVPAEQMKGAALGELLAFYGEVFGWYANPDLDIPCQRIFLRAPSDTQYITIRASEAPMHTSGYEHLGILADSEAELRAIHQRATALTTRFHGIELQPIQSEYGGALLTFRLRFRLPLTLEIQHLRRSTGSPA